MEEKKDIGHLFDVIADTYDRTNHILSLDIDKFWRRRAVRCLKPVNQLLDVAIGTADLSLEILRQSKASEITGIDLSRRMMELGFQKVISKGIDAQWIASPETSEQNIGTGSLQQEKGTRKIKFLEASALDIPFANNSFEAITCAYGVRNFSNLDQGLAEMYRVLRGDGQLMILEFSYPGNRLIRILYDFFFSQIMPLIGGTVSHHLKAYTYFRNSVKNFIWGDAMAERLRAAGFKNVSYKTLTQGITTIYLARK